MEGTRLLGKLVAGVWIARTQGSCSSGFSERDITLWIVKHLSEHSREMQGWQGKMLQTSSWRKEIHL